MTINALQKHLEENSKETTQEFKRLFHGRGGVYENFKHLSVDSIDTIISIAIYFEETNENELIKMLINFTQNSKYKTLVVQRRYVKGTTSEVLVGELQDDLYLLENGIKIKLNLLSNRNSGYFADMKNGRQFVRENAKDKRVLNLFSYTCSFSLAAKLGGAYEIINVDMNKSVLKTGMQNHALNNLDPRGVSFLSYNILKSFSSLKKKGPFDMIIIDPPSFQRGSFEAKKDYEKIIKKLPQIANQNCILLACLNSPDLQSSFILELVQKWAPHFIFQEKLANVDEFPSLDEESSLKNLFFKQKKDAALN